MRKLLMLIGAMIICNAYGESVIWYTDDSHISANSCTSGGNITKPSNPTKSGYRFMGWKVDDTDFTNINATAGNCPSAFKPSGSSYNVSASGYNDKCSWTFPYGSAIGGWACVLESSYSATYNFANGIRRTADSVVSNTADYKKQSCWCTVSSITVNGVTISRPSRWVFQGQYNSTGATCRSNCYDVCRDYLKTYAAFRKFVFNLN